MTEDRSGRNRPRHGMDASGELAGSAPHAAATFDALRSYWQSRRDGGRLPLRTEIDPRAIAADLEYSFILERVAPGVARFRVAGMHLCDLMGMEVRAMPLSTLIAPESRPQFAEALEAVFATPAVLHAELTSPAGFGKPALTARLLLMPLRSGRGTVAHGLGCLMAGGIAGRTPRRFIPSSLCVEPCRPEVVTLSAPLTSSAPGFAEPAAAFVARLSPEARRSRFRVISSAD